MCCYLSKVVKIGFKGSKFFGDLRHIEIETFVFALYQVVCHFTLAYLSCYLTNGFVSFVYSIIDTLGRERGFNQLNQGRKYK